MEYIDRYKKRKQNLGTVSLDNIDENSLEKLQNSSVDYEKINSSYMLIEQNYEINYDLNVSQEEAREFLKQFQKDFNQERFDKLVKDCQKNIITSIVTPFGLGRFVAVYDKVGGNVTTIHNANQGIYANDSDKYKRSDYTASKNSDGLRFEGDGKNSVGSNFTKSNIDREGNVTDAYTGLKQKADTTSPDHIYANSQYHKDGGFMQSTVQKADFSTDENNLALTDRSINQSMRDFDKKEWAEKETEKGLKNKNRYKIDEVKLEEEVNKGFETANNHLPTNLEKGTYYIKNASITGVSEGAKMGVQQAIGLIMTEFFSALFDEILDIYNNGFSNGFDDDRILMILKDRCQRIAKRLILRWKDVAIAFKDGLISGFISNFITVFTNTINTTFKRLNRIIREGIYSIFKAIKMVLYPPDNITTEEVLHEAKKIIAGGIVISLGIIAEEYVSKLIEGTPILKPFDDIITSIFIGTITGLTVTYVVYYLDKNKNNKDAVSELLNQSDRQIDEINLMLNYSNN